ncbi:DUF3152 domain-containing protein [Nocardioides sp.]|uniref:DUF3152 domain-containing protein n=1 Tax=Nocardioides sp. TaxID=35761 RepID=UPI002B26A887|nr:DUF3152 domain-containing protein [Nocardioides sp.]
MRARPALMSVITLLLVGAVLAPKTPAAAEEGAVVNLEAPSVRGTAAFGRTLRADPGAWDPAEVSLTYRWLRDGEPIGKARGSSYDVRRADLGGRLSVQVTATHPDGEEAGRSSAVSESTDRVRRGTQVLRVRPRVIGVPRYTRTVRATAGRWKVESDRVSYRWLRDGKRVKGATGRTYRFAPGDVGHRLRVRVVSHVDGYQRAVSDSKVQGRVKHRVGVQRTATYSVTTRGRITASVKEFARLARQTFNDARGWRSKGVQFRRVASGGSFSLVLAEASTVPSFSSQCSATYSCRVGRYVIINQTRWQQATPPWNAGGRSLRDYRHMVVNHEVGHWLGKGHSSCPGAGRPAPVMMQQSKGTNGCVFNPWPTAAELR